MHALGEGVGGCGEERAKATWLHSISGSHNLGAAYILRTRTRVTSESVVGWIRPNRLDAVCWVSYVESWAVGLLRRSALGRDAEDVRESDAVGQDVFLTARI